jgi:hypothetical protein
LDKLMVFWGVCVIATAAFHKDFSGTLVGRLGFALDVIGLYVLFRVFIQDADSVFATARMVILLLIPVACLMLVESRTGKNFFSFLGGVSDYSEVREGHVRSQGPFAGSIPAGTVGAVCLPLAVLFWKRNRKLAVAGLFATGAMVFTSRSSGPLMTTAFVLFGLMLWKLRSQMRLIRWAAVAAVVALDLVMNAPVYYIIAWIDLTGSSTSWHRAALIDAAITHLNEWWMFGTDYTRHWMPTGIGWSGDHTDITNYYIKMGVLGGLPLLLLFVAILVTAFNLVGKALSADETAPVEHRFMIWTLGAILFGHVATFMSVSYYDQTVVFLYLVLACIGTLPAISAATAPAANAEETCESAEYEANFCHHR